MKVSIASLLEWGEPLPMVVHSLDQALYQVTVVMEGGERLLVENDGRPFRRHSLAHVGKVLQGLPVASLVLRQHSAYDEMIGQPLREGQNLLEVPLSLHKADASGSI